MLKMKRTEPQGLRQKCGKTERAGPTELMKKWHRIRFCLCPTGHNILSLTNGSNRCVAINSLMTLTHSTGQCIHAHTWDRSFGHNRECFWLKGAGIVETTEETDARHLKINSQVVYLQAILFYTNRSVHATPNIP